MSKAKAPNGKVIDRLREACLKRGVSGIKGFATSFKIFDESGDRKLDLNELKTAVRDYGVQCTDQELQDLFQEMDKDRLGYISFDEFLVALRPPMSKRRIDTIMLAFNKLDENHDGTITVDDLKHFYSVKNHPKFLSGEWTEKKCFEEFLKIMDTPSHPDQIITKEEFLNYYAGVSASIDNDNYFDLMIHNAWKLT